MMSRWWQYLDKRLWKPVDGSTLGLFRILFGVAVLYEVFHLWHMAPPTFIDPPFHFTYECFPYTAPWSANAVYTALIATGVSAIALVLGFAYRLASVGVLVGFTFLFTLEEAIYLNHFYLIILLAALLTVVQANRWATIGNILSKEPPEHQLIPYWNLLIIRVQIAFVYFFGGIAKLNADWLRGEPLSEWLSRREAFPFFGQYFVEPWVTLWVFSYGGLIFDLTIAFLLLNRRTRELALIPLLFFHVTNALVFNIGVFPWLMLGATIVFFEPDTARRFFNSLGRRGNSDANTTNADPSFADYRTLNWQKRLGTLFFVGWISVQVLIPLRHWAYPGNVNWTEEGHRFSWRMKLRDKQGWLTFAVTDPKTGQTVPITPVKGYSPPELQLNGKQYIRMLMCPRLVMQYAHYLHRNAIHLGMEDPEVRVICLVSLNGRPHQLLIDPEVDLVNVKSNLLSSSEWIMPLKENQPIGLYEELDLSRFADVLEKRFPNNRFWE